MSAVHVPQPRTGHRHGLLCLTHPCAECEALWAGKGVTTNARSSVFRNPTEHVHPERPSAAAFTIMRAAVQDAIVCYRDVRPGFGDYLLRKGMSAAGRAGRVQS